MRFIILSIKHCHLTDGADADGDHVMISKVRSVARVASVKQQSKNMGNKNTVDRRKNTNEVDVGQPVNEEGFHQFVCVDISRGIHNTTSQPIHASRGSLTDASQGISYLPSFEAEGGRCGQVAMESVHLAERREGEASDEEWIPWAYSRLGEE